MSTLHRCKEIIFLSPIDLYSGAIEKRNQDKTNTILKYFNILRSWLFIAHRPVCEIPILVTN